MSQLNVNGFRYRTFGLSPLHGILLPALYRILYQLESHSAVSVCNQDQWRLFGIGCGNGNGSVHFTALWDHGHIKFWSIKTLGALLREAGFVDIHFERVGRMPPLAKSMLAIARKP